jgi:hypothetical protein
VLGGKVDLVLQAGGYGETLDQAGGIRASHNGLFATQYYDPSTGRTFNFQQGSVAPDGYSVRDVQQGATGDCVFCAAMASAVGQGLDLGGKITYLDGSQYRVLFYGEPIQTVTFDGRIYAAGISPRIDAYGNQINAWAMILERAYLQAHSVPWATNVGPQPTGWIFSAWDKPKVAQYDLIGGDKNNWSVYADHDAQAHMAAALRAGNLVTVGCYSAAVEPGVNWYLGHEFAVLGMWTANGQVMVELYNPHGIPADGSVAVDGRPYYGTKIDGQTYDAGGLFVLPWVVFASHFGTFTTCGSNNVQVEGRRASHHGSSTPAGAASAPRTSRCSCSTPSAAGAAGTRAPSRSATWAAT